MHALLAVTSVRQREVIDTQTDHQQAHTAAAHIRLNGCTGAAMQSIQGDSAGRVRAHRKVLLPCMVTASITKSHPTVMAATDYVP